MTPDGDRMIETMKPGDLVWSRPEHLPDAPLKIRRIEQVFELEGSIVELHIGGQVIKTTGEHPFYVEGLGWTPTFELTEGQRLIGHNGKTMPVERIVLTEQSSTVYNLRIAEDHTYFVGQDDWDFSVWVHNAYNVKAVANGFEIFEDGVSRSIKNREDFDLFYKLGKITKQQYDDALATAAKIAKKEAPSKVTTPNAAARAKSQGEYINPRMHKVVKTTETLAADHIFPKARIKKLPGFNKLTPAQQSEVLNNLENFRGLPQSLNASKGSRLDWSKYRGDPLDPQYAKELADLQQVMKLELQAQIDALLKESR